MGSLRQLFLPHSIVLAAVLAVLASPLRHYATGTPTELLAFLALAIALFLSWRFHSLRGFLAALALLTLLLESVLLGPATVVAADLLMVLTLALVLLVDDYFFDWRAVAYWSGLLVLQIALLGGVVNSWPTVSTSTQAALFMLIAAAVCIAAWRQAEPVLSGVFWVLICLALATRFGWQSAYVTFSALILVVAILERAYRLAYHDELTGLRGRRAFNAAIAELTEHYCIAMVDVDYFKSFNDTFGHDTGDHVLRKVAAHLAEVEGATAFRCGGEEFALVFPDFALHDALNKAEELRRRIERDVFVVRGPERSKRKRNERRTRFRRTRREQSFATNVTVSIGVADSTRTNDPEQVVAMADKALYVAKNSGRNQVQATSGLLQREPSVRNKSGRKLPTVGVAR